MSGPLDPYIPLGRFPDYLRSELPNNFVVSQHGSESEDRQMTSEQPTGQSFDFLTAPRPAIAASDPSATDPAEDFLLDIDADAAVAACEALWNG